MQGEPPFAALFVAGAKIRTQRTRPSPRQEPNYFLKIRYIDEVESEEIPIDSYIDGFPGVFSYSIGEVSFYVPWTQIKHMSILHG